MYIRSTGNKLIIIIIIIIIIMKVPKIYRHALPLLSTY